MCEEFSVLPSEAAREIDHDRGLLARVLEVRAVVAAKQAIDSPVDDQTPTPLMGKVAGVLVELMKERRTQAE